MSQSSTPLLVLVDGHSLAFRSYYAHAKGRDGGLRTSTGIPTSVTYGFLKSMLDMVQAQNPTHMAIAFDLDKPTYRHTADDTYKAGRAETPEDFIPDIQNLQEILAAFNLPVVTVEGYEADDVIGTLARRASSEGFRVKILSGDRDLFQLVNADRDADQGISVLYLSNAFNRSATSEGTEFGPQQVLDKLGVTPEQVVDYKALCGDSSDNIPGVKGIGAKTAVDLLSTYGSLDKIYASLEEIKPAVRKKLEADKDAAIHSQYMAQIHLDVPIEISPKDCKLTGFDSTNLIPLLQRLEFRQFLNQLPKLQQIFGGEVNTELLQDTVEDLQSASNPSTSNRDRDDDDTWFFSAEDTMASRQVSNAAILPQIIDTPAKLANLVKHLKTCTESDRPVSWDTETTALDPFKADLVGIGCCWGESPSDLAYIPIGHHTGETLEKSLVLKELKPILESAAYPKVLQNAKFDRLILRAQGINLAGVVFDTMLASYVLNPEDSHNLADLGLRYLNITAKSYSDFVPKGKTIADMSVEAVAHYCGTDVYTTFHLVPHLKAKLADIPELDTLLNAVELPLEPVLAEMEYCGIRIDQEYLKTFSKQLEIDLHHLEETAYAAAGTEFNLGSPKQLSELLFDTLNLDRKKSRKTKTGYSTDAATLEKLQGDHPVIDSIIEHRTLAKLKSTYVDALPALVDPTTQRVHTDFNQAITATGRLSSSNPNLQNIPIRTAFSRQIRAAFIPEPGWLLAAADYSQIELRILAHLSQEPILLDTYRNNDDVHSLTARLLFEKEDITSEERRLGKVINFGVIYGMGASRFAREANVSRTDAKTFIDRFNERYPNVFAYLQQMQQEAIAHGYVSTILGRRRYFNFTNSKLKSLLGKDASTIDLDKIKSPGQYDAQLLRAAANAPIQGSSADIIKVAMVKLHDLLQHYQARMLLQVHDELVFEVPPEEWDELKPKIKQVMESAVDLTIPLVVEVNAGKNWMETK
ncbi:MAG: DNA polymerase I [Synechococcales cyanobacterium T60_A2020_003]|nr:DNA polymerase I [Synechococcales cyanobacterium T60_A2020_003]